MTLATLVDLKEGIFARPDTVTEVRKSKKITQVTSFYDVVDALATRRSDEILELRGFDIMPPSYYSSQNYRKRGPVVMLDTFDGNVNILKKREWSELKARINAEESQKYTRENGPYIGWGWIDPEKVMHVVRPTTSIQGHQLYQYAQRMANIREKIKVYNTRDSPSNSVAVEVPSRSPQNPHDVLLEHVPRAEGTEKWVEWTRFSSRHDCDFKRHDFTFRHGGRIVTYCPHDAAAHIAHSRKVAEATGRIIPQLFPMFTEPLYRAFIGAAHNTVKIDEFREQGKKRHRTRVLSLPEIDSILMDAWLLHGNKQTFFVRSMSTPYRTGPPIGKRKRMRDFAWFDKQAPGLAFGNE